jgi:hypothetical protein
MIFMSMPSLAEREGEKRGSAFSVESGQGPFDDAGKKA